MVVTPGQPSSHAKGQHISGWIESARYDLAFFILSPLLGLGMLIMAPTLPSLFTLVYGTLIGIPHYFSTFTFYGWEENRSYYLQRWVAFFVGPLLLTLTVALVVTFHVPRVLQVLLFCWNTFHVSRQSCGLLSIYRHRAGVSQPRVKTLTNAAIITSNGMLAFWDTTGHAALHAFLMDISPTLPWMIWLTLSLAAAWTLLRLAWMLWQRWQTADAPRLPELCCLGTSLLLFHPYLWIHDSAQATLGMLIGHFVQYLGLVWLLQRRKSVASQGAALSPWLVRLSTHTPRLLLTALATGVGFLLLQWLARHTAFTHNVFQILALSLTFLHFYLDSLFWAFKEPAIRRAIAPYLMV